MENRLELNKRPVYELPDEVLVGEYRRRGLLEKKPNFKPDLCLNKKYDIKISDKYKDTDQIWIKTNNKELISFIKEHNFNKYISKAVLVKQLSLWKFKKILLEEFYGVKDGK